MEHHSQLFSVLRIRKKDNNQTEQSYPWLLSPYQLISCSFSLRYQYVIHNKFVTGVANISAEGRNHFVTQICMKLAELRYVSKYSKFSKVCYLNLTIPNAPFYKSYIALFLQQKTTKLQLFDHAYIQRVPFLCIFSGERKCEKY